MYDWSLARGVEYRLARKSGRASLTIFSRSTLDKAPTNRKETPPAMEYQQPAIPMV